jgi:hypothetical protein
MLQVEKIRELQEGSRFKLSVSTVRRRLMSEWPDEQIMNTAPQYKPARSHPMKDASFKTVAMKKGWITK